MAEVFFDMQFESYTCQLLSLYTLNKHKIFTCFMTFKSQLEWYFNTLSTPGRPLSCDTARHLEIQWSLDSLQIFTF